MISSQLGIVNDHDLEQDVGKNGGWGGGKIPSLDGLRAVFFLFVFLSHSIAFPGSFGVTGFFFLSGYLITTLLRQEFAARGAIDLKSFYARRALRILPPLYLTLVIAVVLHALTDHVDRLTAGGIIAQVCHFTNYWKISHATSGMPNGTGVCWSLAVEEHFYLIFPLLYLALVKYSPNRRHRAMVLGGLCFAVFLWRWWLVSHGQVIQARTYLATDTRFDSLLFGCLMAEWGNPYLDPTRIREAVWKYALLPTALVAIATTFFLYRAHGEEPYQTGGWFREVARYSIQGVALFPIFICAVRFPKWMPCKLLNSMLLAYVGLLSYSLYLVHLVILDALNSVVPHLGHARPVLALCAAFATAWLMRQLIEKPLVRLRSRLRQHLGTRGTPAAQEGKEPGLHPAIAPQQLLRPLPIRTSLSP